MADKTIWEECQERVVLVTLHDSNPCDLSRGEDIVCQDIHVLSVLRLGV